MQSLAFARNIVPGNVTGKSGSPPSEGATVVRPGGFSSVRCGSRAPATHGVPKRPIMERVRMDDEVAGSHDATYPTARPHWRDILPSDRHGNVRSRLWDCDRCRDGRALPRPRD